MKKLTKRFKVVYEGKKLIFPLTKEGDNAEVFPANTFIGVEFDTYEEAKAFVEAQELVYEDPEKYLY